MPRTTLLCTVGTSLLNPASAGGKHTTRDASGTASTDWPAVAAALAALPPTDRACGAEVNSVAGLVSAGHVAPDARVYLFHSDTAEGRGIAAVLADTFRARGHTAAVAVPAPDLDDADPERFATHGLPNLARAMAAVVREHGAEVCAVNATGGFKGQVLVAGLVAHQLGVPTYYLHERFGAVVRIPEFDVRTTGEPT